MGDDSVGGRQPEPSAQMLEEVRLHVIRAIRPVDEALASLFEQGLRPIDFLGTLRESLRQFDRGWDKQFAALRRLGEAYQTLEQDARPGLRTAGWWIVPTWPMYFVRDVLTDARAHRLRKVEERITRRYKAGNWRRLATELRAARLEETRVRRHLLRAALRAHRLRLWAASIPLLLSQVDGIVKDIADSDRVAPARTGKRRQRSVHLPNLVQQLTAADQSAGDLVEVLQRIFTDDADLLNRNEVLHGRSRVFATEANSLRCFLLLLTVDDYLGDARAKRGRSASHK